MPNRKSDLFSKAFPVYAIFALVYGLGVIYAMSYFFQNSSLGDVYFRTRFDAMVEGYAAKPFVYRQLVPVLIRSVDTVTPPSVRGSVNEAMEKLRVDKQYQPLRRYMPWYGTSFPTAGSHYKRLVASIIILGALLGYIACLFALARALFPETPAVALFAPPFALLAFCSFGYQWQYIYDIPCLFLSTSCFYLIYKQRLRLYMLVFFLSCINKETAIFSLAFFAIWNIDKMENRKFMFLWLAQCALYLTIKIIISLQYLKNSGYFLERNMTIVLTRDVLAEANLYKIVIVATLWFLFTFKWENKPVFLKRALWLFPCVYLAYFLYGFPKEYRVFFDLHAPLVLLATHTLVVGTGIAASPLFSLSHLRWKKPHAPPA